MDPPPKPVLRALGERFAGAGARFRFRGWLHASSEVWEVVGPRASVYVKAHASDRKFRQEIRAYREWADSLGLSPRILGVREEAPRALVLERLPGDVLDRLDVDVTVEREVFARAGRFARALHDLPFIDEDPVPFADALQLRFAGWATRSEGIVEPEIVAHVAERISGSRGLFRGVKRVPCHRDHSPRNWLVATSAGSATFAVLDWEHAGPDCWLMDFMKVWSGSFVGRCDLETAFFAGYGRALTEREGAQFTVLAALHGLSTVAWAREHGDTAFERHGREVLARALRDAKCSPFARGES